MALYRFFEIEEKGNRIRRVQSVRDCPNDEAAVLSAERIIHNRVIEVWQSARLIVRLNPGQRLTANTAAPAGDASMPAP
jgi:hypothetical protein